MSNFLSTSYFIGLRTLFQTYKRILNQAWERQIIFSSTCGVREGRLVLPPLVLQDGAFKSSTPIPSFRFPATIQPSSYPSLPPRIPQEPFRAHCLLVLFHPLPVPNLFPSIPTQGFHQRSREACPERRGGRQRWDFGGIRGFGCRGGNLQENSEASGVRHVRVHLWPGLFLEQLPCHRGQLSLSPTLLIVSAIPIVSTPDILVFFLIVLVQKLQSLLNSWHISRIKMVFFLSLNH